MGVKENKAFILEYFNVLSRHVKTPEICDQYMTDEVLKEHILFFDTIFPGYLVFADEMTAEGNRVNVRARLKGVHRGTFQGIPPTYKEVEMPFAISYVIENGKIVDHWLIADQMALMEQLGLAKSEHS